MRDPGADVKACGGHSSSACGRATCLPVIPTDEREVGDSFPPLWPVASSKSQFLSLRQKKMELAHFTGG